MRGTKYLLIVTVILFAVVFIVTRTVKSKEEEQPAVTQDTVISTTEEVKENIDNEWAMFLVNNQNPLPDDYDSEIETTLVYTSYRDYYMDSRMAEYMTNMLEAAKADGIDLIVASSYRTIEYQQQNFDRSLQDRLDKGMTKDEAYADTAAEVALPGRSEHNAGLSADILSDEYSSMDDDGFKNTAAFAWLEKNAADYGFILRYPEGKTEITGIIYEPWHYRFVGVYYANEVKKSGLCLEEYFAGKGWLDENGKAIKMTGPVKEAPAETQPPQTSQTEQKSEQQVTIIV